jgi:hypothetical protein
VENDIYEATPSVLQSLIEMVTWGFDINNLLNFCHFFAKKMEPRFSLPATTPLSSKRELVIGGVKIYIYGIDELKRASGVEIGVLHLAHMRTRTYLITEAIAHEVLHQYRTDGRKKKRELIAVTMDMRNHGEREVSKNANLTWRDGNENHA